MKKQNLGLLLGAIWFFGFIAGWSARGIYEDQKPPPTPTLSQAHELGWVQGYLRSVKHEGEGISGTDRINAKNADCKKDSIWFTQYIESNR